jgi:hypothetical protein
MNKAKKDPRKKTCVLPVAFVDTSFTQLMLFGCLFPAASVLWAKRGEHRGAGIGLGRMKEREMLLRLLPVVGCRQQRMQGVRTSDGGLKWW